MSQPPSSWDPNAGQQGQSQGHYGDSGGYQQQQPSYSPPPQYGGYPPAETQQQYGQPGPYGQPGYPPQYGTPYGAPGGGGMQRPGAALAAAVLCYIQAGIVLICSFFVLAAGTELVELLLIGILQLISVGLLIFGAVQITAGSGRTMIIAACALQLLLVLYYLLRIASLDELDAADTSGAVVIPLFFAVMPAVALALVFNKMVTQYVAAKSGQRPGGTQQQWGQ